MSKWQPLRGSGAFFMALLLVSAVAALAGGLLASQLLVARPPAIVAVVAGSVAEIGGEWLQVDSIAWERPSPDAKLDYSTQSSVSPLRHLEVRITLQNPTDNPSAISRQEFRLHARNGASWAPAESSVPTTSLGPKQALSSVLAFDVPENVAGLQIVWTRGGQEVRIPIGDGASSQRRDDSGWVVADQQYEYGARSSSERQNIPGLGRALSLPSTT